MIWDEAKLDALLAEMKTREAVGGTLENLTCTYWLDRLRDCKGTPESKE